MTQYYQKYINIFNAYLFVISIYFFEIISLDLFKYNLHIGFFGFFIIFLNSFFFGMGFQKETKIFSSILALLLIFNVSAGYLMPCESLHLKMILSSLAFFAVCFVSFNLGLTLNKDTFEIHIVNAAKLLLFLSITYLLIQFNLSDHNFFDFHGYYLEWSYAHQSFNAFNPKLSSFFSEPSMLALKTIILFCLISLKKNVYNYTLVILSAPIILWFSFSATFMILFLLFLMLFIFKYTLIYMPKLFILLFILIFFGIFLLFFNGLNDLASFSPYIYSRLSFLVDTTFTSTSYSGLVYFQSWLDAYGSFLNTNLLGSGFNQESCFPRFSSIILELASKEPNPIHNLSGGTVFFAKFLNEFGLIGIFILISLLFYLIYLISKFPKKINEHTFLARIAIALIMLFLISITRSNTYFQFILCPFLFAVLIRYKLNNNKV